MIEVGYRVIRGPDWKWDNQDGGDGHVGTVVEIGHRGNRSCPDKTVMVRWDNGRRTNYRTGGGAYDLLVFDSAPSGAKHINKRCDGCSRRGIRGIRWQCTQCNDYDLCTRCYMENIHDMHHKFQRFLTSKSAGVVVQKRAKSHRDQAFGIFPGAKVVRGCDWIWENQDGGKGCFGTVTETRGWQNESDASVAAITWPGNQSHNVYRVGHRGRMDVKYVTPGKGPMFYKDHLPVVGQDVLDPNLIPSLKASKFVKGDKVTVLLTAEVLRKMQEGHGGWNPKMANLIGLAGVVHRITDSGDVRVQYQPASRSVQKASGTSSDENRWTINPDALSRVYGGTNHFAVGEQVSVIGDFARVKQLHCTGVRTWDENMAKCIGQKGTITEISKDGYVKVKFSSQMQWTLNSACLVHNVETDESMNFRLVEGELAITPPVPLTEIVTEKCGSELIIEFISKTKDGDLAAVKQLLQTNPNLINCQWNGQTAFHFAAHKGHVDMVRFFLTKSAIISLADGVGDGALHYAILGGHHECVKLIQANSTKQDVNLANKLEQTPLHFAVIKNNIEWAKWILEAGCDVNKQDSEGDTAAHCCIKNTDNAEMMSLLLSQEDYDINKVDSNGINVLYKAAIKGRLRTTEVILEKFPQTAMNVQENGFTILHISVLNKQEAVSKLITQRFPALVHRANRSNETPLYIAASEGSPALVELLVKNGSKINILTTDGKSCVHAALEKYLDREATENALSLDTETMLSSGDASFLTSVYPLTLDWKEIRHVLSRYFHVVTEHSVYLAIACYLVKSSLEKNPDEEEFLLDAFQLVSNHANAFKTLQEFFNHKQDIQPTIYASEFSNLNIEKHSPPRKITESIPTPLHFKLDSNQYTLDNCSRNVKANTPKKQECLSCAEEPATVVFKPCGHKIVCVECCVRMKKCIHCHCVINKKVDDTGRDLSFLTSISSPLPSIEQQQETVLLLERKVQELQKINQCDICMEKQKDTALKCGHRFCHRCAASLKRYCPLCRKPITGTIKLY